jgi:hypothetical protein
MRLVQVKPYGSGGWEPATAEDCQPYGGDICCVSRSGDSCCGGFMGARRLPNGNHVQCGEQHLKADEIRGALAGVFASGRPASASPPRGIVDFGALERLERGLEELRHTLPDLIEAGVRKVLETRDTDQVGGLGALAKWIGAPTAEAARKRVERDPDLAALCVRTSGGHRRWRKSEVLGYARGKSER